VDYYHSINNGNINTRGNTMTTETLAIHIAEHSLEMVRKYQESQTGMSEWYDGRASAAALMNPCVETLAARNEIRFLIGDYTRRHFL
jgi:hypothetical protein